MEPFRWVNTVNRLILRKIYNPILKNKIILCLLVLCQCAFIDSTSFVPVQGTTLFPSCRVGWYIYHTKRFVGSSKRQSKIGLRKRLCMSTTAREFSRTYHIGEQVQTEVSEIDQAILFFKPFIVIIIDNDIRKWSGSSIDRKRFRHHTNVAMCLAVSIDSKIFCPRTYLARLRQDDETG